MAIWKGSLNRFQKGDVPTITMGQLTTETSPGMWSSKYMYYKKSNIHVGKDANVPWIRHGYNGSIQDGPWADHYK